MSEGTRSEDYSSTYYNDAHLGGYDNYTWENEEWRSFFMVVADRLVGISNPRTALDVGSARGLLVQALAAKGVDARGIDISEHAIASAHPDVIDRLQVASAKDPFEARYDLVTCIEVLEHMSPVEAQMAIDNMTAATDRVLISSSPGDHDEPTHINTRPTAQWATWFAERGFFRRTDVDVSFLSPWAIFFERDDLTLQSLTHRYEQQFSVVNTELQDKRAALLESHRRIGSLNDQLESQVSGTVAQQAALVQQWEKEVLDARHQLLIHRDHVIGTEAEVARLKREQERLVGDLHRARKQLTNVRGRLQRVRGRARRLARRNRQLNQEAEAPRQQPSFARRVGRKVFGGNR